MKAKVLKDAVVLVPNAPHKNFVYGAETLEEGSVIDGNIRFIEGLRKGEPFTYRLFITDKGQIVFLNKIEPMETTEVTLAADGQEQTVVNFTKSEKSMKNKFIGAVAGAAIGFAYAKYKKHDMKKSGKYALIGLVIGVGIAFVIDAGKNKITWKKGN